MKSSRQLCLVVVVVEFKLASLTLCPVRPAAALVGCSLFPGTKLLITVVFRVSPPPSLDGFNEGNNTTLNSHRICSAWLINAF